MYKIEFYGGAHGNYLELIVNVFVFRYQYNLQNKIFTATGACHEQHKDNNYILNKKIVAQHHSHNNEPFGATDRIVRIVPTNNDMLIAITNSFLRAGNQAFDLHKLEIDTIFKLQALPKARPFLNGLINEYGKQDNYSRQILRNYFYSMFEYSEYGVDLFTKFTPATYVYNLPFRAFFDLGDFCEELNNIANFLEHNFYPLPDLAKVHMEFLSLNQGYQSELRCKQVLLAIISGTNQVINLNIIEEAWVNWQIAKIFRCYDLPMLKADTYPSNTADISKAVYEWKLTDC